MKRNIGFAIALLLLSAFIGAAAGEIIARLLPEGSHSRLFFSSHIGPSISPFKMDLFLVTLTFGISLRLNLTALAGMIAALVYLVHRS